MDKKNNKTNMDKNAINSLNFIEDLCWLLDSKKNINFSEVVKLVEDMKDIKKNNNTDSNVDTQELVGILPQILGDSTLFKTNRSLWQFSNEVLKIDILNWEKRSRNEMIGVIICNVMESEEVANGISKYILSNILINKEKFLKIQKEKENEHNQFMWNDAIHIIVGAENE